MNRYAVQLISRGAVNKIGNMLYDYGNSVWLASMGAIGQTVLGMYQIYVSTGSACSSKKGNSRILEVMGLNQSELDGAIRFSFSSENTVEQIDEVVKRLKESVERIRKTR